jgi:hypothetical protein
LRHAILHGAVEARVPNVGYPWVAHSWGEG